ncbi:hypothetical protein FKM82_022426 [Ascaphus truei]
MLEIALSVGVLVHYYRYLPGAPAHGCRSITGLDPPDPTRRPPTRVVNSSVDNITVHRTVYTLKCSRLQPAGLSLCLAGASMKIVSISIWV